MRADLEFLTSPPVDGRASLTQGADAAAWFLATELRKAGLQPADGSTYLQRFDLVAVRLDRDRSSVVVRQAGDEQRFAPAAVFFPDPTREIDLTLDVVFAGYGITAPEFGYDDYAGIDVRGKAVLVFDHEPQEDDPASAFHGTGLTLHAGVWAKTWNAQQHGAAALLVVTEPVNTHRSAPRPPDRANAPPQALATSELRIPRVTLPAEAAAALLKRTGRTPADWQRAIDGAMRPASRSLDGVTVALRAVNETHARAGVMERRRTPAWHRSRACVTRPSSSPRTTTTSGRKGARRTRVRTTTGPGPSRWSKWLACWPARAWRAACSSCPSARKNS